MTQVDSIVEQHLNVQALIRSYQASDLLKNLFCSISRVIDTPTYSCSGLTIVLKLFVIEILVKSILILSMQLAEIIFIPTVDAVRVSAHFILISPSIILINNHPLQITGSEIPLVYYSSYGNRQW